MTRPLRFGTRTPRREDPDLLRGEGKFLADLIPQGALWLTVVRSTDAHAIILGLDAEAAKAMPGVAAIVTAADLPAGLGHLPCVDLIDTSLPVFHPVLAGERIRYAGQPIAAVVASTPAQAEDAAAAVIVATRKLAPVLSAADALRPESPWLYPELGTNAVHVTRQLVGDPDAAFSVAALVVEETVAVHRVGAAPMEMRGCFGEVEPGSGRLVLTSTTQIPQSVRAHLAEILTRPAESILVRAPRLGGGFGLKEAMYPEEVLVLLLAERLGRPVAFLEDRREHFRSAVQAREETIRIRAAFAVDGTATAVDVACLADIGGAYGLVANAPGAAIANARGGYVMPNFRSVATSVVTNKPPLNVYRGAGHPQAVLAMERVMDKAATALGIDRAAIRRHNLIPAWMLPLDRGISYSGLPRQILDSGDYVHAFDMTLEAIGYAAFPARKAAFEAAHPRRKLGLGLSFMVEMTAVGPDEPAEIEVLPDGRVRLHAALTAMGQGIETVLGQVVADTLGIDLDAVEISLADTDRIPFAVGTYASRGGAVGGSAAAKAGKALIEVATDLGADLLGVDRSAVEWSEGAIVRRDGTNEPLPLVELARLAASAGRADALRASVRFAVPDTSFAYGAHAAIVEVDTGTGVVTVLDYAVTHDCGRLGNPMIVDGQIVGGVTQGIGATLYEEIAFDAAGRPLTQGFFDYPIPVAATAPRFHLLHLETPSPHNPLGMKGAGEAGFTGTPAAITNAVADALGQDLPLTRDPGPLSPARIRALLREREVAQAAGFSA
ncbi:MAG: xanthine dehydrogenase family protein [Bauldia sp.]|nr:xanthine dehydrogenase family protein [Bauldia sp.]